MRRVRSLSRCLLLTLCLSLGLIACKGGGDGESGGDRPAAPASGTEVELDGMVGKVVAGSTTSYQHNITSKSRNGYALATTEGQVLGMYMPEMGQVFDVNYEAGEVTVGGKTVAIPEGATVVLLKGTSKK